MTTLVAAERELAVPQAPPAGRRKGSGMNRKPRFAIAVTVAFFVLLYLPIFAVVLFSFNTKKSLTVFEGWSLRWYQAFFNDAELTKSLQTSLVVAAAAMVGSVMIGNLIQDKFFAGQNWPLGAALTMTLMLLLLVCMFAYLRQTARDSRAAAR